MYLHLQQLVHQNCSSDLEYIAVKCRPIYLRREFNVVMLTAVYIPLAANASSTLRLLQSVTISSQQRTYPEAVHIIARGL